jgi:hypothetical protein
VAAEAAPIMDIESTREYLGGISRAHLYRIMPDLEQVHLGSRVFVTRRSCDALIERRALSERESSGKSTPQLAAAAS